jgi:branched-chain amino acid transport system substrate-binding protein
MQAWSRLALFALVLAPMPLMTDGAAAQPVPTSAPAGIKVGLILDMSGPYSNVAGPNNEAAARMAVDDFGGKALGGPIEVVVADHKNSPDRALTTARQWFDKDHVDAIMDVAGSPEAQIVQRLGDVRKKIVIISSAGADRLSNEACTATSVHYTYNTHAIANTVGTALLARGYDTWFFITVDYSFGYDLERDTAAVVTSHGGKVAGSARYPLGARDFESYLARAQQSGAKVIGLANGGDELDGFVKQAATLGIIPGPQVVAAPAMRINAVNSLGLATTQDMTPGESFYWDANDTTRAWSKRFFDRTKVMPNSLQAGVYSSTMHYLQAVAHSNTADADTVLKAMEAAPIDDFFARNGHIRPDGTMVHDMDVFQVKAPWESHYAWDYLKQIATIPGDRAFAPLSQSKCPLVTAVMPQ